MIYSMTGFGKGFAATNGLSAEVEIKSVNSRFLEIFLKIPSSLSSRELEIREILRNGIKRGKVNVFIQLKNNGIESDFPVIDEAKVAHFLTELKKIKKKAKLTEKIKLEHFLANREIFSNNNSAFSDDEFKIVVEAIKVAIKDMMSMKKKEGEVLRKDLSVRIKNIQQKVEEIETSYSTEVNIYYSKLKERIASLLQDSNYDADRLKTELALIADKVDITEETVRLKSHLNYFLESLDHSDETGRRLNFLCQELNREANTISSKSLSVSVTHTSVAIKEEIEKIREQIQNIE